MKEEPLNPDPDTLPPQSWITALMTFEMFKENPRNAKINCIKNTGKEATHLIDNHDNGQPFLHSMPD